MDATIWIAIGTIVSIVVVIFLQPLQQKTEKVNAKNFLQQSLL